MRWHRCRTRSESYGLFLRSIGDRKSPATVLSGYFCGPVRVSLRVSDRYVLRAICEFGTLIFSSGSGRHKNGVGTVAPTPSPSIPDYDRCVKEKNRKKSGRSIVLRTLPVLQQKYPNFCDRGTFAIVIRIGLTGYGRDAVRLLSFRIGIFDLVQKVGIREKSSNFPCRSYRFLPKSINLINH